MCPKILQTERVQWNCYCQYVSMTVNSFSQKRLIVFSWNFAWNCGVPEGSKTSGAEFLRKIITFGENSENSSKIGFLGLLKKYNMLTCFFYPKMVYSIVLFDFAKLSVWEEFGFSVIPQNAPNQSDCRVLWSPISWLVLHN